MKQRISIIAALLAAALAAPHARADVRPHALFTDGLVLQRGKPCPIWGTADPSEKVQVCLTGTGKGSTVLLEAGMTAGKDGKWKTAFVPGPELAGGPYTLTIKGKNTITLKDVYVGEVWVCSGQSNMEWQLISTHNAEEVIKNAAN